MENLLQKRYFLCKLFNGLRNEEREEIYVLND